MGESEQVRDYAAVATLVKQLRDQGMSQRAAENVLRFYGVET